jgi:hypothetical protein
VAHADALLAKGLLWVNDASGLAEYVLARGDPGYLGPAVQRALLARRALVEAGIPLPPPRTLTVLRDIGEREGAQASGVWTVNSMAARTGLHRSTVVRWLQALGGPNLQRYIDAQDDGQTAVFTAEEAREVLRQGNVEWVMDQERCEAPKDEEGGQE